MGSRTNSTNRLAARIGIKTIEVFDISVLPAPISNVINLPAESLNIIIADTVDFAGNTLKFDAVGEDLTIQTMDRRISKITCSSTGIFLDVVNAANVNLDDLQITLSGNGATFWNIFGLANSINLNAVLVNYTGSGTKAVGIVDVGNINAVGFVNLGWTNGITCQNINAINFDVAFELSDFTGSGAFFNLINVNVAANFNNLGILGSGAQSVFDIKPTINAPNIIISRVLAQGAASFFKSGSQFTISNFVDASDASIEVILVNNVGGLAQYESGVAHGYVVGERIFHTNFSEATYLGAKVVTAVDSVVLYKTGDADAGDDPDGDTIAPKALVTATGHNYILDESVLITETIEFNAGYFVKDPLTNTFEIELTQLFPGTETSGEADSGSLTEKDIRMSVSDCGAQKDSLTVGGWTVSGNVSATTVADGTYGDIDFTGATPLSVNEGMTLFDAANGAMRKDRPDPEVVVFSIEFNVVPTGAPTRTYQFKAVISTDGGSSFVDLPDIIETKEEYSGNADERPFQTVRIISMNQGDIVKFQVEGVGTTSGFTADQGCTQTRG